MWGGGGAGGGGAGGGGGGVGGVGDRDVKVRWVILSEGKRLDEKERTILRMRESISF